MVTIGFTGLAELFQHSTKSVTERKSEHCKQHRVAPDRIGKELASDIDCQVLHLYKTSKAIAALQLYVLGKSEQATSGNQMTKELLSFCITNSCAGSVLVEHSKSTENVGGLESRIVKSG